MNKLFALCLILTPLGSSFATELIQRSERPPNLETPLPWLAPDGLMTPNEHFFTRYHLAAIPKVDANAWRLELKGELTKPMRFSLAELKKFKQVEIVALAYCSGNRRRMVEPRVPGVQWNVGAMGNARWRGVRLKDLLQAAGIKPGAVELVFDGADGPVLAQTPDFRKSLPLKKAVDENTLVALEMNGRPLPQNQGFPARLVVPGWTATYWVKHLTSIEAIDRPFEGFWMKSAYRIPKGKFPGETFPSQEQAESAPITSIVVNSLITNVSESQKVKRGRELVLKGLAWDGGSGIAKVEISDDGGRTWAPAELEKDYGKFSWRGFHFSRKWGEPGLKQLLTRATNVAGETQGATLVANKGGYHHNLMQSLKVLVE